MDGFIATLKDPETPLAKITGECGAATEVIYPLGTPARPLFSSAARQKLKIQYPPLDQLPPLASLKLWADTNKVQLEFLLYLALHSRSRLQAIVADDMPKADVRTH